METGLPIGEPAGDENEGIIYTEKAMSYACVAGQVIAQQDKVTLSTAYPDVAFISDRDAIQSYAMFAGYQVSDLAVEYDENIHSFTLPNGGGMAVACGFTMDALIGECIICMQNPNTSALTQNVMKYDLNLDGTIDENDLSVKEMGKNVAVVISDDSFSCGNLLPCSLSALDPEVLLLGQQSGGGSCGVGYVSNAIGSIMQISGENMLVTMKNGYIRDIDSGVTPHIPLSINKMFDREYIAGAVNDYFG